MKRRVLAAVCHVVLWGVTASAGPVLVLEPATVDWGRQTENKGEYPFTFVVKNSGDEELQITRVRPGCSCTKVELKKQTLAPGEATEMSGVLTTKGNEGVVQKGIILTSNDPMHQTSVATLSVRFPINGEGLRLKGSTVYARLREGTLWAYALVENCEAEGEIQIQAMELPPGWDSPQALPFAVKPEDRAMLPLTRKLAEGETGSQALENLPFVLVTDSVKTPRVQGVLAYRPEPRPETAPAVAAGGVAAGSTVRWPMAKPPPAMAPVVAPPPAPGAGPAPAPATPAARAGEAGAAPAP